MVYYIYVSERSIGEVPFYDSKKSIGGASFLIDYFWRYLKQHEKVDGARQN